ncbi:MAG: (2Fe-2S) ferredoxin domain-containing protein [Cyanobacteriota bacterium]
MDKLNEYGKVAFFSLEGRFVSFADDREEKFKRIKVATAQGEYCIKLSKELRGYLRGVLQPGDWVQVIGKQKLKDKTGELKLRAFQVRLTPPAKHHRELHTDHENNKTGRKPEAEHIVEKLSPPSPAASKTKDCIMVCQKSSCRKRGADRVCQAITESLRDRGLEDQVALKGTGCMKQCKQGPCVVFMPDKSRYAGVTPKDINQLVDKHFTAKLKPEGSEPELSPVT